MSLDPSTFPETFEEKDLKAAQSITGELAWLAQRCRPDLAYTVSVMSSMMSKDPSRAVQIGPENPRLFEPYEGLEATVSRRP